ncbi:MAG: response regulator [Pirellulales bacterium]
MSTVRLRAPLALVIDCDLASSHQAVEALAAAGFQVLWARDAVMARQLVRQRATDLLICDVYVGDEPGAELVRELRDLPTMEEVPVMFLSSTQSTDVIRRAHGAQGCYHLRKPVDAQVLAELARAAVSSALRTTPRTRRLTPAPAPPPPLGLTRLAGSAAEVYATQ